MPPIPGRSFANTAAKGDYRAEYHARMTLEQARKLFKLWVVDVYHNNRHSGLMGKTPLQRWDELSGFGVRLPPTAEELVALIGLVVPRQIRRTGVQYLGLRYNSPEVDALRLAPLSDRGNKWSIKIDPEDLTCVYVLDKLNGRWLVAPCLRPHWVKGLNIRMWKQTCERNSRHDAGQGEGAVSDPFGRPGFHPGAGQEYGRSAVGRPLPGRTQPVWGRARSAHLRRRAPGGTRATGKGATGQDEGAKTKRGKGAPISESAGMDLGKPQDSATAHVAQAAKAIFEAATDAPAASAPPTDPAGPDGEQAAAAPRARRKSVPKARPYARA